MTPSRPRPFGCLGGKNPSRIGLIGSVQRRRWTTKRLRSSADSPLLRTFKGFSARQRPESSIRGRLTTAVRPASIDGTPMCLRTGSPSISRFRIGESWQSGWISVPGAILPRLSRQNATASRHPSLQRPLQLRTSNSALKFGTLVEVPNPIHPPPRTDIICRNSGGVFLDPAIGHPLP